VECLVVLANPQVQEKGFTKIISTDSEIKLNYSVEEFAITDGITDNQAIHQIIASDDFLIGETGAPALPTYSKYIAIPDGAEVLIEIINQRSQEIEDIILAPNPEIPLTTDNSPLSYIKDLEIYNKDDFYPENIIQFSSQDKLRGVNTVVLTVNPYQYNPVSKTLKVTTDIEFQISFQSKGNTVGIEKYRNRYWDVLLSDMIYNFEILPEVDYNKHFSNTKETGCEYLIISPNSEEYLFWADSIRNFRTRQGIMTNVVSLDEIGGNSVNIIENYLNNAYNSWDIPPIACLILGDYGNNANNNVTAPIWSSYCVSDNIWGDVNGNQLPDIIMARITANDESQLSTMVTKFINHELNPPTYESFYEFPITALGWQTERWFQLCSEAVGGFWKNALGKDPVRVNAIYEGNANTVWSTASNTGTIINTFGPNGLDYITQYPWQTGGFSGGSAQHIIDAINEGSFMIVHRDHGYEQGWGEPAFNNNSINNLYNEDLIFVWSVNCLTGKYNINGECFSEKFHRYTHDGYNSGALGLVAASEVSYSFVNDTYVWGAMNNMWPEFLPSYGTEFPARYVLPAFANAAGKYFLAQSSWPYNDDAKEVTYNLFHHHGDAFLNVYTEVPEYLDVSHEPVILFDQGYFEISADEDAVIGLTVNNELIAVADGTGSLQSIPLPQLSAPGKMVVTITKQNFFRYESEVSIIDPTGPYVCYTTFDFNDEPYGNGNGIPDAGDGILCSLTLSNIGIDDAETFTVSLTSRSDYITFIDDEEIVESLSVDESINLSDGFEFTIAENVPDYFLETFYINITHGSDNWQTSFQVSIRAPKLMVKGYSVNDNNAGNGNGVLEAGETATLSLNLENRGSGVATEIMADIFGLSPYLTFNINHSDPETILPDGISEASFEVSVASDAPVGMPAFFEYTIDHNGGEFEDVLSISLGLIAEDWETGDISQFDWSLLGDSDWVFDEENTYEGQYSLSSGDIGNNEKSLLFLEYRVGLNDSISFYVKTSCDENDILTFRIDQQVMAEFSGEEEWQYVSFPINEGMRYMQWKYEKNQSGSSGDDKVWIDFIKLPPSPTVVAFAGEDGNICESDTYFCNGFSFNEESLLWSTDGDGTFDNPEIINPIYTPGSNDLSNGQAILTFEAMLDESTETDDLLLEIISEPTVDVGLDSELVAGEDLQISDVLADDYASVSWETSGDGAFNQVDILNPIYTPGTQDLVDGSFDLCMTAFPLSTCTAINDCFTVTLDYEGVDELGISQVAVIYPNPNNGEFTIKLLDNNSNTSFQIYNSTGSLFMSHQMIDGQETVNIDVKGVYLIVFNVNGKHFYSKVFVQ